MNINYRFRSGLPQFSDTFETRTNNLCDEFFEAKENTTSRQILLRFDEELPFIYNESPCQLAERLYLGLQIARLKSDEGDIISACFDCNKALSLYSFFNCDFPELEADLLTEQGLCLDSIGMKENAGNYHRRALKVVLDNNIKSAIPTPLQNLTGLYLSSNQFSRLLPLLQESRSVIRLETLDDANIFADFTVAGTLVLWINSKNRLARQYLRESVDILEGKFGYREVSIARFSPIESLLNIFKGDFKTARESLERPFQLGNVKEVCAKEGLYLLSICLAVLAANEGNQTVLAWSMHHAFKVFEDISVPFEMHPSHVVKKLERIWRKLKHDSLLPLAYYIHEFSVQAPELDLSKL